MTTMIAVTESDYEQYYTYDKVNDYIILDYYNFFNKNLLLELWIIKNFSL